MIGDQQDSEGRKRKNRAQKKGRAMRTTEHLTNILKQADSKTLTDILKDPMMLDLEEKPFPAFIKQILKQKHLKQQDLFLAADIPERYGYKLLSGEKHTRQRDIILRLCFAARMNLEEIQKALKLYGHPVLYPRFPRDAVLMVAANRGLSEIEEVDSLLTSHGMEPLLPCGREEF